MRVGKWHILGPESHVSIASLVGWIPPWPWRYGIMSVGHFCQISLFLPLYAILELPYLHGARARTADHPNAGSAQHQHQQHPRHQTTTRHANHHRDTPTVDDTNAANTHGYIHTTTNPNNNEPRYRHLQHPYHHHHDPGT